MIVYGWIVDYHLKKKDVYNGSRYTVLLRYHFEKAQYYYEKAYGKPFESNR